MIHQHGAIVAENGACTFCVWAPEKTSIELLLQTKSTELHALQKQQHGYWTVTLDSIAPGTKYLYRIDGKLERPDPASFFQPEGVHGASAVVNLRDGMTDAAGWNGIPLRDMVIYELHVGTFSPQGNFQGVIDKLPYLAELGINAIELMPIAQFPGRRNWGYDGVFPFAVQNSYGGPEGLRDLVEACHRSGIAVILDVVFNHLGPEGNYLNDFGPYFTDKYKTPWGKAINYDDAWCDGVRDYFLQNALMWLRDFHIDGLRLDAVHAIWDSSANHFVEKLAKEVKELEKQTGKTKVLIAEFDLNNPRYISSPEQGGYGLDGQWVDEFHHALHSFVTGEKEGYYEDFGNFEHLERAYRDTYVYTGQYSLHRKKKFGVPVSNRYDQFVVFAQNHDQIGNRMLGDRLSNSLSFDMLKVVACAYLMSPSVPMLFMGEEYAEKNPFMYFVSHSDEELIRLVREGRKKEFSYFNWEGEVPDPFAEETFEQCRLSFSFGNDSKSQSMLSYYRHLIDLRKTHPAFRDTSRDSMIVHPANESGLLVFERRSSDARIVVLLNFSKQVIEWPGDADRVYHLLSASQSAEFGGHPTGTAQPNNNKQQLVLEPESASIFLVQ